MKKEKFAKEKDLFKKGSNWKSIPTVKRPSADLLIKRIASEEKEKKEAKFTARLSQSDFESLKTLAQEKGMGYQTLLGYIIHGYVTGNLVDVEEIRKVLPDLKIKAG